MSRLSSFKSPLRVHRQRRDQLSLWQHTRQRRHHRRQRQSAQLAGQRAPLRAPLRRLRDHPGKTKRFIKRNSTRTYLFTFKCD